jgi:hypothetical protein
MQPSRAIAIAASQGVIIARLTLAGRLLLPELLLLISP